MSLHPLPVSKTKPTSRQQTSYPWHYQLSQTGQNFMVTAVSKLQKLQHNCTVYHFIQHKPPNEISTASSLADQDTSDLGTDTASAGNQHASLVSKMHKCVTHQ